MAGMSHRSFSTNYARVFSASRPTSSKHVIANSYSHLVKFSVTFFEIYHVWRGGLERRTL